MRRTPAAVFPLLLVVSFSVPGADTDEFKIKREEVFEFTEKPMVERSDKGATISFASKGRCDVTVAVESVDGKILRHLASGVLGPNAPAPFQKNALKQTIAWDGKNDQGAYVENLENVRVRVSLGLDPHFERTLNWEPHKRISHATPLIQAGPEGVLVFEGKGVDHVRLFDHDGNYSRTIYPFSAAQVEKVDGLQRVTFPQDGKSLPLKLGFVEATLLSSGTSSLQGGQYMFGDGFGATSMALRDGRIALAFCRLNRLSIDGQHPLPLEGPQTGFETTWDSYATQGGGSESVGPSSMAFSPDGRTLYLTGYFWRVEYGRGQGGHALQGVMKLDYQASAAPQVFAGVMKEDEYGTDNAHFRVPTSVACDSRGRVYVSDYMNDRIQVFTPDGKHFKTIAISKPARVCIHQKTQEIYVFSYPQFGASNEMLKATPCDIRSIKNTVTRLSPVEEAKVEATLPIPVSAGLDRSLFGMGQMYEAMLDSWSEPAVIWMVGRKWNFTRADVNYWGADEMYQRNADPWATQGIALMVEKDGKLEVKRSFGQETVKSVYRAKPPDFSRQRLFVNPANGKVYVVEDLGFDKSFLELLEIDPESGKIAPVELPFNAEDMCFDQEGQIYLRTENMVARFEFPSMREVPWDYGEEVESIGFATKVQGKRAKLMSGLPTPGKRPMCFHQGGMNVSARGDLAVSCVSHAYVHKKKETDGHWEELRQGLAGRPYSPTLFPGRARFQEIHIWDKHGKLICEDAVPGLHMVNGVGLDNDDNLYVLAAANRVLDGKPYFNMWEGTMMKCSPKHAKVISTGGAQDIPLLQENYPTRPPQFDSQLFGKAWIEGAEWMYGGVGFDGNTPHTDGGYGCSCWNARFAFDYFNRSFAPEVSHYSVAVLDSSGNLILRIGKYGNVDDGMPRIKEGGPASPRSIGSDEVALFHARYMAVQTDRFLYIADAGNARVLSVKLGYHATETAAIKN